MELYSGKKDQRVLEYLQKRRSMSVRYMSEPAPTSDELDTILKAAARVPDHGRLFPWYFMVFEGDARQEIGDILRTAYASENPDAAPAKLDLEAERFLRAPLVVGVISRIRCGKHPQWEQILSAGAVCQNLSLAANALGYSTNWLTEWYSYNETFRNALGLEAQDNIAGFIYIGTATQALEERDRPQLDKIVTRWRKDAPLKKGLEYERTDMDYPVTGFKIVKNKNDV